MASTLAAGTSGIPILSNTGCRFTGALLAPDVWELRLTQPGEQPHIIASQDISDDPDLAAVVDSYRLGCSSPTYVLAEGSISMGDKLTCAADGAFKLMGISDIEAGEALSADADGRVLAIIRK